MILRINIDNCIVSTLNPIISQANNHQFLSSKKTGFVSVESRMFLWCKSGKGKIRINQKIFQVEKNDYFILPWRHKIRYEPDEKNPLLVAGIHLIPWHDPHVKISWGITAHGENHNLYDVPYRKDRPIKDFETIMYRKIYPDHPLMHLSEFIVKHFLSTHRSERTLQQSAITLIEEARAAFKEDHKGSKTIDTLHAFIENNISKNINVNDLAKIINRSPSQINRICKLSLNTSPAHWINQCKIKHATQLLLNDNHSIRQVAESCGFPDQFHFSRLFKNIMNISPLKYKKKNPLI